MGVIIDTITEKDPYGKPFNKLIVKYDNGYVFYENDFTSLDHAYALTIHKSQGSQWHTVIMPISKDLKFMLDNNLFYTGYTRAQKINIVIGDKESIEYSIKTEKSIKRYTGLFKHK